MKGIIYKVTNEVTGEVYVGATTKGIQARKKDHLQKASKGYGHSFHDAIATLGPEAFKWEQIDTASSINELAEKEKENIYNYNSKKEGYNSDSGGGIKKTVYKYDLFTGRLIDKYDCLEDAASSMPKATAKQISKACLSVNKKFGGHYWNYTLSEPFKPSLDARKKHLLQRDKEGKIIRGFCSISEASEITGVNKSSIAKVCRGERNQAGGFNWDFL